MTIEEFRALPRLDRAEQEIQKTGDSESRIAGYKQEDKAAKQRSEEERKGQEEEAYQNLKEQALKILERLTKEERQTLNNYLSLNSYTNSSRTFLISTRLPPAPL